MFTKISFATLQYNFNYKEFERVVAFVPTF